MVFNLVKINSKTFKVLKNKKVENQEGRLPIPFGSVFNFKILGIGFKVNHFRCSCLGLGLEITN
jgi:hypothetical protein